MRFHGWLEAAFWGEKSRGPSVTAESWRPRLCMRAPVFWAFEKLTCNNIIWTYVGRASSLYSVYTPRLHNSVNSPSITSDDLYNADNVERSLV